MRSRLTGILVALAAIELFLSRPTFAGTIISSNLPPGSLIVNVDGTADGAANFSGTNADDWYQPFNTSSGLLEHTFQPGTYTFRVIDQNDAAAMFPSLTAAQLNQIGGAWTYNSPWATDYLAFDVSAATDANQHQLFTGAVTDNGFGYGSASAAYQEAINVGYYNQIVTGTGRYTGTAASSYTFANTQTLIFTVPDYYLPDNNGIISVLISPAPEPTSLSLIAIGSLALLHRRPRAA